MTFNPAIFRIPADTLQIMRIALAAKRWADAVLEVKRLRTAFTDAWEACHVQTNNGGSDCLFESLRDDDGVMYWKYTEIAGEELRGKEPYADPRWRAQRDAWKAYRDAGKRAASARAALTRMVRRWEP